YSASQTWTGIGYSLLRLLLGYSISFILGAILGILASLFKSIGYFLRPGIGIAKTIPTVGVTMVLFSLTLAIDHKYLGWIPVILVIVVALPLLYEAFKAGMDNEDKDVLDALALEGSKKDPYSLIHVRLPDAFPYIRLGMAQSFGLSFKVLIMSEVLSSSNKSLGLGSLIAQARTTTYDGGLTEIPAYVLISLFLMAIIDIPYLLLKLKERKKG
nr:ABC transporter permease subunit [Bacilli bacterium]